MTKEEARRNIGKIRPMEIESPRVGKVTSENLEIRRRQSQESSRTGATRPGPRIITVRLGNHKGGENPRESKEGRTRLVLKTSTDQERTSRQISKLAPSPKNSVSSSDELFHYLSREHRHKDGSIGRDYVATASISTGHKAIHKELGIPYHGWGHQKEGVEFVRKEHLIKGIDYGSPNHEQEEARRARLPRTKKSRRK